MQSKLSLTRSLSVYNSYRSSLLLKRFRARPSAIGCLCGYFHTQRMAQLIGYISFDFDQHARVFYPRKHSFVVKIREQVYWRKVFLSIIMRPITTYTIWYLHLNEGLTNADELLGAGICPLACIQSSIFPITAISTMCVLYNNMGNKRDSIPKGLLSQ